MPKPISDNLNDYLVPTPILDFDNPQVFAAAQSLAGDGSDIDLARQLFEWVRDRIPHTKDIGGEVVTCTASQVLEARTGICYAKSHLLAAMLRAVGIPAGLCYQVCLNDAGDGKVLHGLNGVYLRSLDHWIRVDARGNTGAINARFSTDEEHLAFPSDPARGEFVYEEIWTNPVPEVVQVLTAFTSRIAMWPHLPKALAGSTL